MNAANITINDLNNPEMPLDSRAGQTAPGLRTRSGGCTVYRPTFRPPANWEVREDKGFYIPDLLSDTEYDANSKAYSAFAQQAKHLHKVEGLLDDAWNLVRLMEASLGNDGDDRAMQIEAGLKAVEKKLSKAHAHVDKHHTRYTNLFFAYFDLREKMDEGKPN
jgi:hypothetical protein